jgi:molybdate transport system substrate-binding protein
MMRFNQYLPKSMHRCRHRHLRKRLNAGLPGPPLRFLRQLPLLLLMAAAANPGLAGDNTLHLAVAANFRSAAQQIAAPFEVAHSVKVTISSASTGVLAAQLQAGAPFDLLLAADRARPALLHRAGLAVADPSCYAVGSLVLLGAAELDAALSDPGLSIAIANPATAPYGVAALSVLSRDAFAGASTRRVVRGSNVQQALQFFDSGATDLALVARSLRPDALPVPAQWHAPIEQYALIPSRSGQPGLARAFLDHIASAESRQILAALGYGPCS